VAPVAIGATASIDAQVQRDIEILIAEESARRGEAMPLATEIKAATA
jgi:hypothetical protein